MSKRKIVLLLLISAWSISMWVGYFHKKNTPVVIVKEVGTVEEVHIDFAQGVSDVFWEWEAQSRLNLIDQLIADEELGHLRTNWNEDVKNLKSYAHKLVEMQMVAYGFHERLDQPHIEFIPLRGDANGLYVPDDRALYLNSRIQWDQIDFERFVEVVLHETMHHILTHGHSVLAETDSLYNDLTLLSRAAYFHTSFAKDAHEVAQVNPQELVAYRTERAGRYAGMLESNLTAWQISTRMQEIRALKRKAGYN